MTNTETFLAKYNSQPDGLTTAHAQALLTTHGPNALEVKKKRSLILEFLDEFKDLLVLILMAATIFAFLSGETTDAILILFIILLNATIGFAQKFKAEKAIEALQKMITPQARVLRNGHQIKIPASEVVPGDIFILEEGDTVNADAIIFEENELETQEAILTGESIPVGKKSLLDEQNWPREQEHALQKAHLIYMGTMVTHGTGRAVVINTGMKTEMGKIAELTTQTKKDKSPLEKEIQNIGVFVGKITFVITAVLFIVGFLFQKKALVDTLIFATSVAVAAVPEGLPATITIALAIGVQRLARNNAIVKQLSSVETLGATTVICSDKTGTLTKNEMTVKELYFDRHIGSVHGVGYNPEGSVHINDIIMGSGEDLNKMAANYPEIYNPYELLLLSAGLCNNAAVEKHDDTWKIVGDPTEAALITFVKKSGFNLDDARTKFKKIHEYPFDSTRKLMTVLMQNIETGKIIAFCKGAPGSVLGASSHVMLNNHSVKIDEETYKDFLNKNEKMASRALRCLAFAYRELTPNELRELKHGEGKKFSLPQAEVEKNFTFIGLTGMVDPPRPEVAKAIDLAHKAGIKIYIITGDHGLTAEAVARQIGLLHQKNHRIIYGDELEKMHINDLKKILAEKHIDTIFARVSPADKLKIVSALKELGEVVAVTGDGVNDAPALKRADIGIAMGITGTDVSKEAANMVLSDDSFATIVTAVKEGRTIYENLKKSIFFVFSSNIGELVLIFGALILNLPAPLSAILILFINLITDVLPAIALGVEPSEHDIMEKTPRHPKQKILSRDFIFHFLYTGVLMGTMCVIAYMWDLQRLHAVLNPQTAAENFAASKASTLVFMMLITIELAHALNSRSANTSLFKMKFFSNPKLIGGILISFLLGVAVVGIPVFQQYLHTTALDRMEWLVVGIGTVLILCAEEIRKLIVHHLKPKINKIKK